MVACPICPIDEHGLSRVVFDVKLDGGVESSFGVRTEQAVVYECSKCGVRFRIPPDAARVLAFYGPEYHERMEGTTADAARELQERRENEQRINYLKRFKNSGRVLDVGCSLGHFAKQLHDAGFDVMGCDISAYACERSASLLGSGKVLHGPIESFVDTLESSFDAVTMMDVIEHFTDVVEPLSAIHRILKPGGLLFLRTPTLSSPFHHVAELSFKASRHLYKRAILKLYHAEHLYYFDERSVRRLLERVGFQVVEIAPDPLLWANFRSAELHYGILIDTTMALIYFIGRALRRGHGMRVIARR